MKGDGIAKVARALAGEEMTQEDAIERGMVVFTKAEAERLQKLTGARRRAFIDMKLRQHAAQQKARFKQDRDSLVGTHPLERAAFEIEAAVDGQVVAEGRADLIVRDGTEPFDAALRRRARNRLKRLRRNRGGR